MFPQVNQPTLTVGDENLNMTFSPQGGLAAIRSDQLMVSLFETPHSELPISNIFLRQFEEDKISATPLLFFNENIETFKQSNGLPAWQTKTDDFEATVRLKIAERAFFYDVDIINLTERELYFDLIYGQDVGLADEAAVKTNEAYCSQYLDHQVFHNDEIGFTVCCRQNLPQSSGNPRLQLGAFSPVAGYSTDGYQFFGQDYKFTGRPQALECRELANEKYQYEMGYVALQLAPVQLALGEQRTLTFYGMVEPHCSSSNWAAPVSMPILLERYKPLESAVIAQAFAHQPQANGKLIHGGDLSESELERWFGSELRFVEKQGSQLLSFFYGNSQYVTLAAKERYLERATGHVIASGNNTDYRNPIMSATHYIYGVFNSQLTLGNTSFNKLLGVCRNPLNQFTNSGQRIWIKQDEQYRALGMPSAYEVGSNYSRWIYKYGKGVIEVRSFAATDMPLIQLEIEVHDIGQVLDIAVSHQLVFGNNEGESQIRVRQEGQGYTICGDNTMIEHHAQDLSFAVTPSAEFTECDILTHPETHSAEYLVLKGLVTEQVRITIGGELDGVNSKGKWVEFSHEVAQYQSKLKQLTKGFKVDFENDKRNSQRLNESLHWFTHNALVHYSTPHGLEQYSGAAWGTRDVAQGPFELFMSMQEFGKARDLLKEIYSHQYQETGTWPQWFMFDQYASVQQEESHGDIVVWPLKALADYLTVTGDMSLLEEALPYTMATQGFAQTPQRYALLSHVERQVQHIIENLVPGTSLSCYGDGDWDDTLQPANQSLRENMVSGWTIPLTLQAFKGMIAVLDKCSLHTEFSTSLSTLTEAMEQDYHHYLIKDGTIAGFIHFERDAQGQVEQVEYLLHPADQKTGITQRLLPASRSIISETFSPAMAESHMTCIKKHLVHPDGVRLMDKMAQYKAGEQTYFKRAELAANLGREVGLQYCHAHIRFIEALCKLGDAEAVFDNLYKILPVGIQETVPNAALRQANAYFSSSDGQFNDRYMAYEQFKKLSTGQVAAKGGWRIYSSGPGIYLNQLISNVFGLRFEDKDLLLDPVLSPRLGKVTWEYTIAERPVKLILMAQESGHTPKTIQLNGQNVPFELTTNRYRSGGARVCHKWLNKKLKESENILEITL